VEPNIFVKQINGVFANGKTGIEVCLFRHKILLTRQEAILLRDGLQFCIAVEIKEKKNDKDSA
jgi:hypothetical protein